MGQKNLGIRKVKSLSPSELALIDKAIENPRKPGPKGPWNPFYRDYPLVKLTARERWLMKKKIEKDKLEPKRLQDSQDEFVTKALKPIRVQNEGDEPYKESIPPPKETDPAIPLLAFEPQLTRINAILHRWLNDCTEASFPSPEKKFQAIATMTRALHENIRLVGDTLKLLAEIHDQRTFQRVVLEAIRDISPETRLKIVKQLQKVQATMGFLGTRSIQGKTTSVQNEGLLV